MKKFLAALLTVFSLTTAAFAAEEVPVLRCSYGITTHQQAFMIAMARGSAFRDLGIWLEPVVEKEKYDLFADGKKVARLNVIVTKSGAEAASLFAQNHMDLTVNSFPAMLSAIDSGTKIKVIGPLQSDGIAMFARNDVQVQGWDGFSEYVKNSKRPVTVGYHSPTSAPKIVFEAAMDAAGFKITGDASATKKDADILMVDLKSVANMIPALNAKQVEFCVAPAPTPEVVEDAKQGHIILQLGELPPVGRWTDFPCCCIAASTQIIEKHPEAVKTYVDLITKVSQWCMEDKAEASQSASDWLGVPVEIIEKAHMSFSTTVTPTWLENAAMYPEMLNRLGQFGGALQNKTLSEAYDLMFDFRFVEVQK